MDANVKKPDKLPTVVALMGPTASGKTALATELCEKLGLEIISVDSALVYKGLNIGAAKPSPEELAQIPHRLIDIRDPIDPYSAADFCADARGEICDILARGNTPLLVGGTMLYFKALLEGLSDMPGADAECRIEIEREAQQVGWQVLHQQLEKIDPQSAEKIHPLHSRRISRALEVYRVSGKTMSQWQDGGSKGLKEQYHWVQIAISPKDRTVLHARIKKRFQKMLDDGFLDEVRLLYNRGDLSADLPAIRAVGYRQAWQYLSGDCSFAEMCDKSLAATRQLAKRQLTWLRSWQELNWIYTDKGESEFKDSSEILNEALNFLDKRSI